ncbi:PLP-dependent transferase [Phaeospirillum tilakii]|uniref:PLP-dependent transferase n=1 Tax=Phaeospirillum tilakii TaxID=741673 RepID=A0ABW5CDD4_9PROT
MPAPETLALHGGAFRADPVSGAVVPPIHFTTSYQFRDTGHASRLFGLEEIGYTYTRTVNPTREVLERRIVALEGGAGALAVASGAAARLLAILALAGAGDSVVIAAALGPDLPARPAIAARLADPADPATFTAATDAATRLWLVPSLDPTSLAPTPLAALAAAAAAAGVPLIVDNSDTPLLIRPGAQGAAAVIYDAAPFIGGHGTTEGGLLVDTGRFDWAGAGARLPSLNQPNPAYHGQVWSEVVRRWGASPYIARARGDLLRDLGVAISPMAVFHLLQGLETLPLRLRVQSEQAQRLAQALAGDPRLSGLRPGPGPLLALDLPSAAAAARFRAALTLVGDGAAWGSVRSALRPAPGDERRLLLSVGLEHPDDLLADLDRALAA